MITGEFGAELQGSFVLLPFDVPAGTTAVRVKYCWDPPIGPFVRHTLDLGLYQARSTPGALYGPARVPRLGRLEPPGRDRLPRGLQERGRVRREPAHERPGKTTRGFVPGPITPVSGPSSWASRRWSRRRSETPDGKVGWRVEIQLSNDPGQRRRAIPARALRQTPARAARGWYGGDMHVHAEHSALGDATMTRDLRLRLQAAVGGRRRPRLHDALGLRGAERVGRDRPLPGDFPGQADRAQRGGDHLPRAHEQPHERHLRRLPHRAGLRARARRNADTDAGRGRRASCSTTCTPRGASPRSTTRRSSPRRIPSSSSSAAAAHGTTPTRRPTTRRSMRSRSNPAPPPPRTRIRWSAIAFYERALDLGREDRGGRRERLPQRRAHGRVPQPAGPGRDPHHDGLRRRAVGGRHPARRAGDATPTSS